jgi:hypothetical protein
VEITASSGLDCKGGQGRWMENSLRLGAKGLGQTGGSLARSLSAHYWCVRLLLMLRSAWLMGAGDLLSAGC